MNSIRRNLLLSLLIAVLVIAAIMVSFAYFSTTNELHGLFTDNLRRMALVIKGQAFTPVIAPTDPADMDTGELEESYVIQIWDGKGVLLRSSRPDLALPLQKHEGLSRIEQNGQVWEVYHLKADNSGYVQIAQPQEIVATMIGESAARALAPFALCFVVLIVGGWIVVGRSMSPLNQLSETIGSWEADRMQMLKIADAPVEIQPIVGALNTMLIKLDKAMDMQRQFTADSAHELRTPLTAIKLQLDNLVRADNEMERGKAIQRLSEGIDRCIHLASQLLVASRAMAVKTAPDFQSLRLNELVRSSMATFVVLASNKNIDISFESTSECHVLGDEDGLRVLINNLLDNAIRYTPEEGTVVVRVFLETNKAVLEVSDNGAGIPKNEQEKIFQRFYRIPVTTSVGSGLGLSIVKTVAENHGATLSVMNGLSGHGTTFRISFEAVQSNNTGGIS